MKKTRDKMRGLAPGTLVAPEGAVVPTGMHVICYDAGSLEETIVESVAELKRFRSSGRVLWVNLCGLGNTEMLAGLGALFGLHPLALEDTLTVRQRPKVEDYKENIFVVMRMLHFRGEIDTEQVSMFLGRDFVLTVQERPGDCFEPVRERLRNGGGQIRTQGADYLMYSLIDAVTDNYYPFLESLGEVVEQLEDEVVDRPTRQSVGKVHEVKRSLLQVRRAIWPLREAISTILRDESPLLGEVARVYLRDCYDHAVQVLDMVETYRELAGGLMDVYLSSLSNKMNEVMKVLTIIATIFIPMTFIAGIYGMNFDSMPELHQSWGYPAALGVMVAIAVFMLFVFRRMGWLGGKRED